MVVEAIKTLRATIGATAPFQQRLGKSDELKSVQERRKVELTLIITHMSDPN